MMPKALFFNVPGHGHVIPSLPLVTELVRRKHHIVYFNTEGYRSVVEAAGAEMRAYPTMNDDYFTSRSLSGSVPQKVAHALVATAEAILPELLEVTRLENPDYIVFDGMCPWGYLVAKIMNCPSVASLSLPPLISPPPSALPTMLPHILPMVLRDFGKGLEAHRRANALAKKYNAPPFQFGSILNNTGDISLSYTSSFFQAYADTVSPSIRFVGWTPYEVSSAFAFDSEKPLIYISLGTLNNDDVGFFKTCIEAFAGSDYAVVMTTGNRIAPDVFGVLPDNIKVHRWLPQTAVLKHSSLFISHGGLNSVHDALYYGVPLLLVPQQAEQTLTAMRVVELGAGLLLKKGQVSIQTIHDSTRQLLSKTQFKAAAHRIGETLREAGGAVAAANEIEALLRTTA
jgi:MGT family glycosyltransferase